MEKTLSDSAENQTIIHPQYRRIALTVYSGVLALGVFGWLSGTPFPSLFRISPFVGLSLFCVSIVILIALEFGRQSIQFGKYIRPNVHLPAQIMLTAFALATAPHFYGQFLFLVVILFTELTFSRRVRIVTVTVSLSILFLRLAFGPRGDLISSRDLEALLIFMLAMWLIHLLARMIKGEWQNRLNLQSLNDRLQQSHQQLQENTEQLAEMAVVTERNRLARDIHDSLGHHLAAVSIQLEMAIKLHKRAPDDSFVAMKQARTATQEALQDIRKSVSALRNHDESFQFVPAIELLIERIATNELAISYQLDGDANAHSKSTRLAFFRAIQEGLTNIHKHASASQANLWLQFASNQARLRIIDDGIGFDLQQHTSGLGLRGVRERVENLGGCIQIESRPNEGTILDIQIPQSAV